MVKQVRSLSEVSSYYTWQILLCQIITVGGSDTTEETGSALSRFDHKRSSQKVTR